jgi:hypothetical protein
MANIWDDLVKWFDDASKVVGKEAGDLTQKGTLKLEIFELKRKLRDGFTELGSHVYEALYVKKKDDWQTSKQVKSVVQRIKMIQRKLTKKNSEYVKIGKGKQQPK